MAAVAGSSTAKVPRKASDHCQSAEGCSPVQASSQALATGMSAISSRLHKAISSSQPTYQRSGRWLRSMRGPSVKAPSASPPKKAATTASTAAASWPSHSPLCCVHTS